MTPPTSAPTRQRRDGRGDSGGRGAKASTQRTRRSSEEEPRRPRRVVPPPARPPIPPPPPPRLGNPIRRMRFGLAVLLILFAILGGKLIVLQLTDGKAYAAVAEEMRMAHITLVAPRGSILDRSGNSLAHSVPASSIYADPKHVGDPAKTAQALSPLLGVPEPELVATLSHKTTESGKPLRFVYLARQLNTEVGAAVQKMVSSNQISGIGVLSEERRDVPSRDIAANLIGFTGTDGYGLAGMEASYDKILRGHDGKHTYEVGLRGQQIPTGYDREVPARPGANITLTIDRDLQYETQRVLNQRLDQVHADSGSAIVMDAHTGEVLSMASYPNYDASDPASSTPDERSNVATSMVLEPGSVHKAITLSAALQTGVIGPDVALDLPPTITKGGKTFQDTHAHEPGKITLSGILAHSSNIGTIMIADKLGAQNLYDYQRKFGLGSKTGVGLPAESAGIVQPPSRWSGPSYGGIPIGIGVGVTPLQMTCVYATIANDGVQVKPKIIKEIRDSDGKDEKTPNADPSHVRVISAQVAREMRDAMQAVVSKDGTAASAALSGYNVAGKTGTGLRVVNNKYMPGNVTSFVGMVPAENPRYVISIFAHVPAGEGGAVTGPAFSAIASFALRMGDVPPSSAPPANLPLQVM